MEHSEPDWGRGHAPNMEEQDRQIRGKRKGVWSLWERGRERESWTPRDNIPSDYVNGTLWRDEGREDSTEVSSGGVRTLTQGQCCMTLGTRRPTLNWGGGSMGRMDTGCGGRACLEGLYSGLSHENSGPGWTWIWTPVPAYPGEGNGTPLQYSCLENPMDGGAW